MAGGLCVSKQLHKELSIVAGLHEARIWKSGEINLTTLDTV